MRIAIEATQAFRRHRGWGRYNLELLKALLSAESENTFEVFYHRGGDCDVWLCEALKSAAQKANYRLHPVDCPQERFDQWEEDRSVSWLDQTFAHCQLYHAVTEFPFLTRKMKKVVTIHDISPLRYPHYYPPERVAYFDRYLQENVSHSDAIISVSRSTQDEILGQANLSAPPIHPIHNGVSEIFFTPISRPPNRPDYFLYVGSLRDPLKNPQRLFSAFAKLRSPTELWLVNNEFSSITLPVHFEEAAEALPQIRFFSNVSDAELHSLYAGALAVIVPSLHEGFGLPAAEAMAAGVPLICGSTPALLEVTQGLCFTFDPLSEEALHQALEQIKSYPPSYLSKARQIAQEQFRWSAVARKTLQVYETLV